MKRSPFLELDDMFGGREPLDIPLETEEPSPLYDMGGEDEEFYNNGAVPMGDDPFAMMEPEESELEAPEEPMDSENSVEALRQLHREEQMKLVDLSEQKQEEVTEFNKQKYKREY